MISVTPISGMTVTTIIITAVLLLWGGLPKGPGGMLAVLLVGGVVCTALSMAGTLVTEFKLGYWLGASPKKIQWSAVLAAVLASTCVTATIMILNTAYGYKGEGSLAAPQANMMASALQSFVGTGEVPWLLYGIGVVVALLVQLVGISGLAFALGMYLPMEINTPILVGAFVAMLVKKSATHEATAKARSNKGILIASGLDLCPGRLPPSEPGEHAFVVRALPVDSAAGRTNVQRFLRPASIQGDARRRCRIGSLQQSVVQQATREGAAEPVELEAGGKYCGELVDVALRQDQRDVACCLVFTHQLILRQEIAILLMALAQQVAILLPAICEQGVVAGSAQVAA